MNINRRETQLIWPSVAKPSVGSLRCLPSCAGQSTQHGQGPRFRPGSPRLGLNLCATGTPSPGALTLHLFEVRGEHSANCSGATMRSGSHQPVCQCQCRESPSRAGPAGRRKQPCFACPSCRPCSPLRLPASSQRWAACPSTQVLAQSKLSSRREGRPTESKLPVAPLNAWEAGASHWQGAHRFRPLPCASSLLVSVLLDQCCRSPSPLLHAAPTARPTR